MTGGRGDPRVVDEGAHERVARGGVRGLLARVAVSQRQDLVDVPAGVVVALERPMLGTGAADLGARVDRARGAGQPVGAQLSGRSRYRVRRVVYRIPRALE